MGGGREETLKESGANPGYREIPWEAGSFLRFAFQTGYVSGDVRYPGVGVSRQQKRGTRGNRE